MRSVVAVLLMCAPAWAQNSVQGRNEADTDTTSATELDRPVTKLRVLRDPYEIASFYRADGAGPAAPRYEDEDGNFTIDPRTISSFYRSDSGGYEPFAWHYRAHDSRYRAGRWRWRQ